jgi:hypothetical protein
MMPRNRTEIPSLPAEGGTYELQDGAWACVQRTVDAQPTTDNTQTDAVVLEETPPSGVV